MKKIIAVVVGIAFLEGVFAAQSAKIRVDTRMGTFGGKTATAVEAVGEEDGSDTSVWVTSGEVAGIAEYPDGWYVRDEYGIWNEATEADEPDTDVLVLNAPEVVGGRLAGDMLWTTGSVRVVRHNVVVPDGVTLTIDPEIAVKFTEEARIVVEEGGRLVCKGAWFAEIADDEWVDGDTNLDGTNSVATGTQDWISGVDPADYVHVLMLDGAEQIFPARTYTRGEMYGVLPTVDRYDDGWYFRGWVTNQADTVGVAPDQLAEMDQPALYCSWEAVYLTLSTGLVEFAAYSVGETHTVEVASNDKWTFSCDAEWLHLESDASFDSFSPLSSFDGSGSITLSADVNRSATARSATVRISRENGSLAREVNVVQAAMAQADMPAIVTADGLTQFSDYVAQVWITNAMAGVTIWYTIDGSEPSALNGIRLQTWSNGGGVAGVINIYGSCTVKAIAARDDLLDSEVCSVRMVREATLAEAMDVPDLYVTTDGTADWQGVTDETAGGLSAVRSGAMSTSASRARYSRLYLHLEGQGVLTFKWKVSCERDLTGNCDWDYLAFLVGNGDGDNTVVEKIEGQTGWRQVTHRFTGRGNHVVQWVYRKNAGFADIDPGQDCGWVDEVTWTPTLFVGESDDASELIVNPSFLFSVGLVGASADDEALADAAQEDSDGDGYTNEQEAILGTNPNDPNDKLEISILDDNGVMRFGYGPDNSQSSDYNLDYRVMGRKDLGDNAGWKDVTDLSDEERAEKGYKFFKLKVKTERR